MLLIFTSIVKIEIDNNFVIVTTITTTKTKFKQPYCKWEVDQRKK
jgi:hypothetical protein